MRSSEIERDIVFGGIRISLEFPIEIAEKDEAVGAETVSVDVVGDFGQPVFVIRLVTGLGAEDGDFGSQ